MLLSKKPAAGPVATLIAVAALCLAVVFPGPARACGWGGDGDSDEVDTIIIGADGIPVDEENQPDPAEQTRIADAESRPAGGRRQRNDRPVHVPRLALRDADTYLSGNRSIPSGGGPWQWKGYGEDHPDRRRP